MLCPVLLHAQHVQGYYCASDDPSQHQVNMYQFSPFLTWRCVDAQTLTSRYTEYNHPTHLSYSVICMRPSLQGLTWFKCCELSKGELLMRFMSYV